MDELEENPHMGIDLDNGYRKVSMSIASKGKGKSGGARIITFDLIELNECLYLIYAYDKSDIESVNINIIKKIVEKIDL